MKHKNWDLSASTCAADDSDLTQRTGHTRLVVPVRCQKVCYRTVTVCCRFAHATGSSAWFMAEKHHFLSLDKSQESIPMWKAQKMSRNVAQIRHTGYSQKCKEISPISYGKSKRQTSLKFIQYKFQGHKGIVADQVQLGSISIQPMADPLTNSEFYRSHRTQSPAFNVSAPRSWEISRSQDHARRGLKFIDFIVKWPMPRTSANCPNNGYAHLLCPTAKHLLSQIQNIQNIQKDPKGRAR